MEKTIVGIDPGRGGGIATIKKGWAYAVSMPETLPRLNLYLKQIKENNTDIICLIEKVQIFDNDDKTPGKKYGIKKMLASYEQLKAALAFHELPYVEVASITWQSDLAITFRGQDKSERKAIYKDFAQKTFPMVKVTLNTSDALCIAYFGLRRAEIDMSWLRSRLVQKTKDLF